jgi:hypothetical protein
VIVRARLNRRLLGVWLVLSTITIVYLWIDHTADHHGRQTASTVVTVSAIIIALAKVRIIMGEFMEVRGAPVLLRRLANLWIAIMAAVMLGLYFAGKAVA